MVAGDVVVVGTEVVVATVVVVVATAVVTVVVGAGTTARTAPLPDPCVHPASRRMATDTSVAGRLRARMECRIHTAPLYEPSGITLVPCPGIAGRPPRTSHLAEVGIGIRWHTGANDEVRSPARWRASSTPHQARRVDLDRRPRPTARTPTLPMS